MPLPAQCCRFVQAADKTVCANCVCSGAHCAAVGGFAALRMRRALYGRRAPCRLASYGVTSLTAQCPPDLSFRGAKRRGNLAGPGWITGYFRQKRNCLPEIAPQGHFLALRAQGATSGKRELHQRSPPTTSCRKNQKSPSIRIFPVQFLLFGCFRRKNPL